MERAGAERGMYVMNAKNFITAFSRKTECLCSSYHRPASPETTYILTIATFNICFH